MYAENSDCRCAKITIESLIDKFGEDAHGLILSNVDAFRLDVLDDRLLGRAFMSMLQTAVDSMLSSRWTHAQRCCIMLLNITWEQLNTGHWKNVNIVWRHAYYIASYIKAISELAIMWSSHCNVCTVPLQDAQHSFCRGDNSSDQDKDKWKIAMRYCHIFQ